jgi:HD-GYP domain-containing protein (c-di-GMP phosphodiesterase class II)
MTSDRPYRAKMGFQEAQVEISRCAGRQFDSEVVKAFFDVPIDVWEEIRRREQDA